MVFKYFNNNINKLALDFIKYSLNSIHYGIGFFDGQIIIFKTVINSKMQTNESVCLINLSYFVYSIYAIVKQYF
jgi:hypothetical protein